MTQQRGETLGLASVDIPVDNPGRGGSAALREMRTKMEQTSKEKALLWSALLAALRITESEVTTVERERLQWAARELWRVSATPGEVEGRALRMRRAYSVPLSAKMLVSHWAEFAAPKREPAPVRDRGAKCCRWCEPDLAER